MASRKSLVKQAHDYLTKQLNAGDIVIDATVGNGYDTVFLAQLVTETGKVYGFDLQASALLSAQQKLDKLSLSKQVNLTLANHATLDTHINLRDHSNIQAIMFNLGYLPGTDKSLVTQKDSTLAALTKALTMLAKTGTISVIAYPGHPGGAAETKAVLQFFKSLDPLCYVTKIIESNNTIETSPIWFLLKSAPILRTSTDAEFIVS